MQTFSLQSETDLQDMRALMQHQPNGPSVVDFEELMQMPSIRAAVRLWREAGQLAGFAYVDDYNNLWFEMDPENSPAGLEREIVAWGEHLIRERNRENGEENTLDASCDASNRERLALLERNGFKPEPVRSLQFVRLLDEPVEAIALPAGFSLRCVSGESEVEDLTALHRAAFGTEMMTVERRLAIMRAPQYLPELDLLAVAPDGRLAAFCVGGLEEQGKEMVGFTDPIGVHPDFRGLGLAKTLVCAGLNALRDRGAVRAELGTSSENSAMQALARSLGFKCVSEKCWFSKHLE